jgi:hypothetical protein
MRLYSYKVVYDIGFAPNPFHGTCTLATCKPRIRNGASVGDWIAGVGSRAQGTAGKLVYAMEVGEKLTFDQYWTDPRFERKRPDRRGSLKYRYGDNVYHRSPSGDWIQEDCRHSMDDGTPNPEHVKRDTSADAVLIAAQFTYWGGSGPQLPPELRDWNGADLGEPGRDHTYTAYPPEMVASFVAWAEGLPAGYQAPPIDWRVS